MHYIHIWIKVKMVVLIYRNGKISLILFNIRNRILKELVGKNYKYFIKLN